MKINNPVVFPVMSPMKNILNLFKQKFFSNSAVITKEKIDIKKLRAECHQIINPPSWHVSAPDRPLDIRSPSRIEYIVAPRVDD